jgi:hypothetical protein
MTKTRACTWSHRTWAKLLEILSYDVEASVTEEEVDFTRFEYEPRLAIKQFRVWLKDVCAQAKHEAAFDAWMKTYVKE